MKGFIASSGRVALGTASWALHDPPLDVRQAARVLRAGIECGIDLVDTAHVYTTNATTSYAEQLVCDALRLIGASEQVAIATKGGHSRSGDTFPIDGRPEAIRKHCDASLIALGVDRISLYFLHKPDPRVPIAESVGAMDALRVAGKIDEVGVSNVSVAQLSQAREVASIAAVQNRLGPLGDDPVVEVCAAHGIRYLGYAPFGGSSIATFANGSIVAAVAGAHSVSRQRLTIAGYLASSAAMSVVVGARRPSTIRDSALAGSLKLSPADLASIAPALGAA